MAEKKFTDLLQQKIEGLILLSESDFSWKINDTLETNTADVEELNYEQFFDKQINNVDTQDAFLKEQAIKYKALLDFLNQNTSAITLQKFGKIKRTVLLTATSKTNEVVRLSTYSVET